MVDENKKIIIIDEDGKECEMEILFTFEKDEKKYVVYFDPSVESEDVEVYASIYDDNGNLYPVETDEEWDMIDEMLEAFSEEEK